MAAVAPHHVAMLWFRKGLRLHDNPALLEAAQSKSLYPVFCLDPMFLSPKVVGVNRMTFLLESLGDLHNSLLKRQSGLLVLRGKPEEVFPRVWKEWGVTKICFESDTEPYAKKRDANIRKLAQEIGIEVSSHVSHTLYDPEELIKKNGGSAPSSMGQFEKLVGRMGPPAEPAGDPPQTMPPLPLKQTKDTAVPSLEDLAYTQKSSTSLKGGESAALARITDQLADKEWVATFEKPKGNPAAFLKPATTCLSPYLKFGSDDLLKKSEGSLLHAGRADGKEGYLFEHKRFADFEIKNKLYQTSSISGELNFLSNQGSGIPATVSREQRMLQIDWDDNDEFFRAWEEARTGYPWIDAIMTQLREQGWMHHLARHSVACFLTRGDLYISWERGRDTFDRLLVDADWSINNGNWMWLSASAFFSQYFRVYSPITFGRKYDKSGEFVRHFLPVLKDMPDKFVYSPWEAPLEVQKKAKCIIGKDYPMPIVDHQEIHKANIGRMKSAYDDNKAANLVKHANKHMKDGPKPSGKRKKVA